VFDTVGGETTDRSIAVVKPSGLLLCIVNMPTPEKVQAAGIRVLWGGTKTITAMKEIDKLLHKELITPFVRKIFKPLSQAAAAQDYSQRGGPGRGKIVLRISAE
jgi:NADPH:quinone reductase-like Zn-dependent oxidoreductase